MQTVLMAVAAVINNDTILLRKTDPTKNPYREPWALFGGRIEGEGSVQDLLNVELETRWNFTVTITERLWWDEDVKVDHDGITKRFVYIDAICIINSGEPSSSNKNEELQWVGIQNLTDFELNPPTKTFLSRIGYIPQ